MRAGSGLEQPGHQHDQQENVKLADAAGRRGMAEPSTSRVLEAERPCSFDAQAHAI